MGVNGLAGTRNRAQSEGKAEEEECVTASWGNGVTELCEWVKEGTSIDRRSDRRRQGREMGGYATLMRPTRVRTIGRVKGKEREKASKISIVRLVDIKSARWKGQGSDYCAMVTITRISERSEGKNVTVG